MSQYKVQSFVLPAVVSPTPIWTELSSYRRGVPSFTIQASGDDIYVGGQTISDDTDSLEIKKGSASGFGGLAVRGTDAYYDLSKTYYLGGAGVLILEVEA